MSSLGKMKRLVYGLPVMAQYRAYRTGQLARRHAQHPLGFRFAGQPAFFDQGWEPREREVITEHLRRASVFIDVGANQGIYTCLAASMGILAVAIEPEAGNLRFLLSNIRENRFKGVEIYPVAIGAESGVARFYGDGHIASLVPGWHGVRDSFSELTPLNTLDNLFASRWPGSNILIKIDVEGAEIEAIKGAKALLSRECKPSWLIETFLENRDAARSINTGFRDLFVIMYNHGYRCTRVDLGEHVSLAMVDDWIHSPSKARLGLSNYLFEPT